MCKFNIAPTCCNASQCSHNGCPRIPMAVYFACDAGLLDLQHAPHTGHDFQNQRCSCGMFNWMAVLSAVFSLWLPCVASLRVRIWTTSRSFQAWHPAQLLSPAMGLLATRMTFCTTKTWTFLGQPALCLRPNAVMSHLRKLGAQPCTRT